MGHCNGLVFCKPRDRVSKLEVPKLAMDSNHHPRVLAEWQKCYLTRRCGLCSNVSDRRSEVLKALEQFSMQGLPISIVNKLRLLLHEQGNRKGPNSLLGKFGQFCRMHLVLQPKSSRPSSGVGSRNPGFERP